jgi:hypothetical protein
MIQRVNRLSESLYHHLPEDGDLPEWAHQRLSEAVNALEAIRVMGIVVCNSVLQRDDHLDGAPLHPNHEYGLLLGIAALAGYVREECDVLMESEGEVRSRQMTKRAVCIPSQCGWGVSLI